jgi:hypothetical protein
LGATFGDAPVGGGRGTGLVGFVIVAMAGFSAWGDAVQAVAVPAQEGVAVRAGIGRVGEREWEAIAGGAEAIGAKSGAIEGAEAWGGIVSQCGTFAAAVFAGTDARVIGGVAVGAGPVVHG